MSGDDAMGDLEHAAVGSQLRLLIEAGTATGLSDGDLVERFVSQRDELAFAALVKRHGPMVQRVFVIFCPATPRLPGYLMSCLP
jgi:hypothetical protein